MKKQINQLRTLREIKKASDLLTSFDLRPSSERVDARSTCTGVITVVIYHLITIFSV